MFTTLILEQKDLEEVGEELEKYQHLRNINLSQNAFSDVSILTKLPYLIEINCSKNKVECIKFLATRQPAFQYLKSVNLSENKIKAVSEIEAPLLKSLNLAKNEIASCAAFKGHSNIETFELRRNLLVDCKGISDMCHLTELYLAENKLTSLEGLSNLPNLTKLSLRQNEFVKFEHPLDLPKLEYLNLRENKVESLDEVAKLNTLKALKTFNMLGNPIADDLGDGFKKETLILFLSNKFDKINKDEVVQEDIDDAIATKAERFAAAEEARKIAEEEAALKKAEEEEEAKKKAEEEAEAKRLADEELKKKEEEEKDED